MHHPDGNSKAPFEMKALLIIIIYVVDESDEDNVEIERACLLVKQTDETTKHWTLNTEYWTVWNDWRIHINHIHRQYIHNSFE